MTFSPKKRDHPEMDLLKPKRAKWYTVKIQYSPEKEDDDEPVLILKQFSTFPHVSFDKVSIGKSKTCSLKVLNPLQEPQQVVIEKFPSKKGFHVTNMEFMVEAEKESLLDITWTPTEALNCREIVSFRTSSGCKTQAYLLGSAVSPIKQKKTHRSKFSFRKNLGNGKRVLPQTEACKLPPCSTDNKENLISGSSPKLFSPEMKSVFSFSKAPAIFALKQDHLFAESPIRRQTYIINEMFEEASMSNGSKCIRHEISVPCGESTTLTSPSKRGTFVLNSKQEAMNACQISPTPASNISELNGIQSPRKMESTSSGISISDSNFRSISEANASDKDFVTASESSAVDKDFVTVSLSESLFSENQPVIQAVHQDTASVITDELTLEYNVPTANEVSIKGASNDVAMNTLLELEAKSDSVEVDISNIITSDLCLSEAQEHLLLSACVSSFIQEYHDPEQENECSLEVELSVLQDATSVDLSPFKSPVYEKDECLVDKPSIFDDMKDRLNHSNTPQSPNFSDSLAEPNDQELTEQYPRCSTGIMPDIPDMTIPSQFFEVIEEYIPKNDKAGDNASKTDSKQSHKVNFHDDCTIADCSKIVSFDTKQMASITKSATKTKAARHTALRRRCQSVDAKKSPPQKGIYKHDPKKKPVKQAIFKTPVAPKSKIKLTVVKPNTIKKISPIKDANKTDNSVKKTPIVKKKVSKVCPKRLHLVKASVVVEETIRHPNIFAARNMYYDERWMEKQETAFTRWLNFVLTPPEELKTPDQDSKVDGAKLWVESMKGNVLVRAPTKEDMSLRIYTAIRMMNHLRFASCKLYQSEQVTSVIKRLEKEIELKRLLVRKDRQMHADVGIKQHLLELLLSYNPLWLRIGLETIYGEFIPMQSNQDIHGLSRFIIKKFLNNADIAAKYAHPTVPHSFKPGFEEEMKKFTLKKFLLLVYYLDVAKTKRLINHDPCLFCKGSEFKKLRVMYRLEPVLESCDVKSEVKLSFLPLAGSSRSFSYPHKSDILWLPFSDILIKVDSNCPTGRFYTLSVVEFEAATAKFKASRDLLLVFSREYLSGEGDVTRHLKQLGYVVNHQQTALDEFDYAVTNLAVDLRCGLRLARVMELLLQDWSLCTSLRIPTISRLQKVHNNEVAMKAFVNAGHQIEGDVTARDLVNGHREKTLDFLWQIIFKTQISKLIDIKKLKSEIVYLKRNLKLKADVAAFNAIRMPTQEPECYQTEFSCSEQYAENESIQLLFVWCQVVCGHYDLKVHNFTVSFSDGRALCYLVHHYHPHILPLAAVKQQTSTGYFEPKETDEFDDHFSGNIDNPFRNSHAMANMEHLIKNEKENLKLVFEKLQDIGGVPILTQLSDMSNTIPDEKVVITLVAYLNIRLMDLSQEIRAARVIQLAWRNKHLNKRREQLQVEIGAVTIIQRMVRKFLERRRLKRMTKASIVIQSCWRMRKAKQEANALRHQKHVNFLSSKAVIIQAIFRGYSTRQRFAKMNIAATVIQAYFRRWEARSKFLTLKKNVIVLQQHYRATKLGTKQREEYLHVRRSVILVQACSRRWLAQQACKRRKHAIEKLQACFRQLICKQRYLNARRLIISIQQRYKTKLLVRKCQREFQEYRLAALRIQHWYRCCRVQKQENRAAIIIQAHLRRTLAQKHYFEMRNAILTIQQKWKATILCRREREKFLEAKKLKENREKTLKKIANVVILNLQVIRIQRFYRNYKARELSEKKLYSAVVIQHWFRAIRVRLWFLRLKKSTCLFQAAVRAGLQKRVQAAICIQSHVRSWLLRKQMEKRQIAASKIQQWFRGIRIRLQFLEFRRKICLLQAAVRVYLQRRCKAIICIQSHVRSWLVRKQIKQQHIAASKIQRWFRGMKTRLWFLHLRKIIRPFQIAARAHLQRKVHAIIFIQSCVRSWLVRRQLQKKHFAAMQLQRWFRAMRTRLWFLRLQKNICCFQAKARWLLEKRAQAAICIQAHVRSWLTRQRIQRQHDAAMKIQRWFRGIKPRLWFLRLKANTCLFQTAARAHLQKRVRAVICIQSWVRSWLVRKHQNLQQVSAIKIQRWFREMKTRLWFLRFRKQICVFQAVARIYLAKRLKAVICIQSYVRSWLVRRRIQEQRIAVRKIQHWFIEMKTRLWFLKLKKTTILFQAAVRALLQKRLQACICLQSHVRRWLVQKQMEKEQKAVTKIQAIWRGYKIRSIRNRSVAAARERIKRATASASPDQTLASRTAAALDYLLKYRTMYQLLCALSNLDVATRLSPICCEQLANSGGIEVIIQLIKSCNRSVPHMEVIKYSINVLLNISKYEKTVKSIWKAAESVEVIIEMMRIFREKGLTIFTKCCSLLWILCQEPYRSEAIKENSVITDQIISLHYLTMRKKKIDEKHMVRKIKMAEGLGTSFLHSTLAPKPKRSLIIQPDWILGNTVMREFEDPVTAVCAVMKVLSLKEK